MKHIRDAMKGIKALAPDIEAKVLRQQRHVVLEVRYRGAAKHLAVSTSPKNCDHAVINAVNDIRRHFKLEKI